MPCSFIASWYHQAEHKWALLLIMGCIGWRAWCRRSEGKRNQGESRLDRTGYPCPIMRGRVLRMPFRSRSGTGLVERVERQRNRHIEVSVLTRLNPSYARWPGKVRP